MKKKLKTTTLEEFKTEVYGKKGSKKRDELEKYLKKERKKFKK